MENVNCAACLDVSVHLQICKTDYVQCNLQLNSSKAPAACNCSRQFLICLEAAHCRDKITAEQVFHLAISYSVGRTSFHYRPQPVQSLHVAGVPLLILSKLGFRV
jgi:hypothetical protein